MEGFYSQENESINIVLVNPEIPPNTGNIARLCGATKSTLHLVHPLGFKIDDKHLRRAGLDYWDKVEIIHHESLDSFLETYDDSKFLLFSARGSRPYTESHFEPGCFLIFGSETKGLPEHLLKKYQDKTFYIPIWGRVRSLNLSTAVGIVAYEAYRNIGFGRHWRIPVDQS
ncbi:tRNA (cytidine(34)-2'-O)-methyltransferase [Dissulfuribacter thermophilus]|uniref:Putative tRNA (cytidine(34)-2'-O)-methyltransferase n=1 Tax=Dissulfuribacter thermophilus TaxID=1156395 RepID=A0A1B9F6B5_9BACT|nr:tRNA (cytidine(34)-2'-O)-methyltransferase [Dissulfuribacter thermophilus]OCC15355.1 tRNA (cytidine(34)-2'-O)-methyltransferase [Dissulfuribacter thermophilus]